MAEKVDAFRADRMEQPGPQKEDVAIGYDRRDQKVAPVNRHPVQEDDGHRIFQHREGERTEKDHGDQQRPADHGAMAGQLSCPRMSHSRYRPNVASSLSWSMICDSAISMRMSSGTMDSSV